MAPSPLVLQTIAISTARLALFYFCRTYLLRSLYHDLRVLSSQSLSSASPTSNPDSPSGFQTPMSPAPIPMIPRTHSPDLSDIEPSDLGLPSPSSTTRRKSTAALIWQAKTTEDALVALSTSTAHSEKNIQLSVARTTFALCFSESCVLFLMVMSQVAGVFLSRTRKLNWDVSLTVLICLILLVIPLLQCTFITYRSSSSGSAQPGKGRILRRALIILIPYTLYLFTVFKIPVPEALASADFISKSLSRLTVIGVLILGLISGYGCVSTATMFFANMARSDWVEPSRQDIIQAEQSLFRVRSDLLERRQQVKKRAAALDAAGEPADSTGWFGRLSLVWKSGDAEMTSLQREIQGLEALESEMEKDLKELVQRKARIKFSRTWKGKIWKWIGWTFGLYCAFRIFSSLLHLISHQRPADTSSSSHSSPTRTPDLITLGLIYVLSFIPLPDSLSFLHLTSPVQIAAVSRQISLVLVGCIVLVSVRGVMAGVGRVLRMVSGGGSGSGNGVGSAGSRRTLIANIMLLVLAQVMGLYLLSTLIQLRNSFPPDLDGPFEKSHDMSLFASLPSYEVFNSLFDWAFLLSAGFTGGGRWIRRRIGL